MINESPKELREELEKIKILHDFLFDLPIKKWKDYIDLFIDTGKALSPEDFKVKIEGYKRWNDMSHEKQREWWLKDNADWLKLNPES